MDAVELVHKIHDIAMGEEAPAIHCDPEEDFGQGYSKRMTLMLDIVNELERQLCGTLDPDEQPCPKCGCKVGHYPTCPDGIWVIR